MSHKWVDRLSDYFDEEMSPGESVLLEAHLTECEECVAILADLRRVVSRADGLDDPPVATDLWTGIAHRIGATPPATVAPADASVVGGITPWHVRRFNLSVPQLIAAGIGLVLVSGTGVWAMLGRDAFDPPTQVIVQEPRARDQVVVSFVAATRYDQAVADLARVLEEERELLDPETVRIVEENLALIDRAVERVREALLEDPESEYIRTHLE